MARPIGRRPARPPGNRSSRLQPAPPAVEVDLTVELLGGRGDGVARLGEERVFLADTAPGDVVRARLVERRGDGWVGKVNAVLAPSPQRQAPPCRHFGRCGGCALQHVDASTYAAFKQGLITTALAHHGLVGLFVEPTLTLPPGTRRRARLQFRRQRGGAVALGFSTRSSHDMIDLQECPVLQPELVALVPHLRLLGRDVLAPGEAGAASLTLTDRGIDALLTLPTGPDLARLERLADFAEAADLARLSWRIAPGAGKGGSDDFAGGGAPTPVAVRRQPRVIFSGVAVDLPDDNFLQASLEAEDVLVGAVRRGAGLSAEVAMRPALKSVDLFAGLGTFTFALARHGAVHAVDGVPSALGALAAAANRAGMAPRVTTERRDLDQRPLSADELQGVDVVVFDPPRAGAAAQAAQLARSAVPRLVAVSCNPATFARDARRLVDGGYRLDWVRPIDQFVWSAHVELVAAFVRD